MAIDLPADANVPPPPALVEPAQRPAEPLAVDSHGYYYVVKGNLVLPASVVRATIEAHATPKEVLDALNVEYKKAGYPFVAIKADVSNKLVALEVISGRITEIDAPDDIRPYYARLLGRGEVTRDDLIEKSALADIYTGRNGTRTTLSFGPAKEVGGTAMTVKEEPVPGAKPWSASLNFGNLGSRYSSRYTWSASGSLRPGAGLEMTAGYTQGIPGLTVDSRGSQYQNAIVGGTIATPWGVYGASWNGVTYKNGDVSAPLNPEGDIYTAALTGVQLAYADDVSRLAITEGVNYVDNSVLVFDNTYPLTDQRYGYASLGFLYSRSLSLLGQIGSFSLSINALQGLTPRRGTFLPADPGVPDPHFTAVQGSLTYNQSLPYELQFSLSLSGQYADATMPQNNQWVVGGFGNLTAWLPAVLVGDGGLLARATLQSPSWGYEGYTVNANGFAEAGTVVSHYTPVDKPYSRLLADAGVSITGNTPFGTSLSVAYAWPIASRNVDLDAINTAARANVYFTLTQSF
ncbi:MAG TPA: ShlB/FhaC/HecB family hemolysin secretion/activation protein [Casimicrobiaceae bacterium]|nr:ShlB/FhaC/HecB family hemolysin secretion/activation protein [Casimicrobiaceae bacterium]